MPSLVHIQFLFPLCWEVAAFAVRLSFIFQMRWRKFRDELPKIGYEGMQTEIAHKKKKKIEKFKLKIKIIVINSRADIKELFSRAFSHLKPRALVLYVHFVISLNYFCFIKKHARCFWKIPLRILFFFNSKAHCSLLSLWNSAELLT